MHDLAGQRVTVMGLGRFGGGVGVTRFLVDQGADVLVTDTEPAEKLQASIEQLADLPDGAVTYRLGEHNVSDFTTCDLVVANPAVKPNNRFLRAAQAAGIPITTEIRLLVERLPNRLRTIGVTGSAGKSTVTAMIGHILKKAAKWKNAEAEQVRSGRRDASRVWIGGNLGGSLLPYLHEIGSDDWVVLELSSFMLYHLRDQPEAPGYAEGDFRGWSPHIAVITNISPNHLDWHGSFETYVEAKRTIFDSQDDQDLAVVPGWQRHQFKLSQDQWPSRVIGFADTPEDYFTGELLLPGSHNRMNAVFAAGVTCLAGIDQDSAYDALADFPGLPHRLQFVAERHGVRFFNDSKCTTPEAAMLAIDAFESGAAHIILGGYDKGSDLAPLAAHAAQHGAGVYTMGATGDRIAREADRAQGDSSAVPVVPSRTLGDAVDNAIQHAQPGQVVLLSPGCASWDQFDNFEQRGNRFVEIVSRLTA